MMFEESTPVLEETIANLGWLVRDEREHRHSMRCSA